MTPSQPHSLRVPLMAGLELGLRVQCTLSHPCAHPVAVRRVYVSLAPMLVALKRGRSRECYGEGVWQS